MRGSRRLAPALLAALCAATVAGCLGQKAPAGPERSPAEVFSLVLGANPGLSSLRAVVEARLGYAGRRISLPGVLVIDSLGGFRLDLLDPLDRPAAMIFSEGERIVQYRPGTGVAASLGVFPDDCRGVAPDDWVDAVLASSPGPQEGEGISVRQLWGDRLLQRSRDGVLRQSVRFREETGEPQPRLYTWYCGGDAVMAMKVRTWAKGGDRRLPSSLELSYLKTGLTVAIELREVESNPPLSGTPLRPRLAEGTRWSIWRLP